MLIEGGMCFLYILESSNIMGFLTLKKSQIEETPMTNMIITLKQSTLIKEYTVQIHCGPLLKC